MSNARRHTKRHHGGISTSENFGKETPWALEGVLIRCALAVSRPRVSVIELARFVVLYVVIRSSIFDLCIEADQALEYVSRYLTCTKFVWGGLNHMERLKDLSIENCSEQSIVQWVRHGRNARDLFDTSLSQMVRSTQASKWCLKFIALSRHGDALFRKDCRLQTSINHCWARIAPQSLMRGNNHVSGTPSDIWHESMHSKVAQVTVIIRAYCAESCFIFDF